MNELFISDSNCNSCNDQAVFTHFINGRSISLCYDHGIQLRALLGVVLQNKKPIIITKQTKGDKQ